MWILFALTSATILASRKIQEKKLVDSFGQSLGWMIRTGSAIAVILLWLIFSRDISGVDSWQLWVIVAIIALIMYPLQTYTYYRSMLDMPLSLFGLLSPTVLLSTMIFGYLFLGTIPSFIGIVGIIFVSLGIIILIPKKNIKKDIHISYGVFIIAIISYSLMGLGGVLDKMAMSHTSPFFYAMLNQTFSAISIIILSRLLYKDMKLDQGVKRIIPILSIGLLSGVAWFLGVYSIQISPNVRYSEAMINTHAIMTTLYGVMILKENITKEKILAFLCMILALISFAFA